MRLQVCIRADASVIALVDKLVAGDHGLCNRALAADRVAGHS